MSQEEFHHAFLRKFPFADVIPVVDEYLSGKDPEYNGISGVNPEDFEEDGVNVNMDAKIEVKSMFSCRGCGKEFDVAIARAGHERHCKTLIKDKGGA